MSGLSYFSRHAFSINEGGKWIALHVRWFPRSELFFDFAVWVPWLHDNFRAYRHAGGAHFFGTDRQRFAALNASAEAERCRLNDLYGPFKEPK